MIKGIIRGFGLIALVIGLTFIYEGTNALASRCFDRIYGEELIYTNGPLPAFSTLQDYSANTFLPLVRLESKDGQFFCTGTVISDDYVLTAAHCLIRRGLMPTDIERSPIRVTGYYRSTDMNNGTKSVKAFAAALNQRADYALVRGNFKEFMKAKINTDPMLNYQATIMVTCGFPWGVMDSVCFVAQSPSVSSDSHYIFRAAMYPGMSGGPVFDLITGQIIAVNYGTLDGGYDVVNPLIGLFETLGVRVIKDLQ